MSKLELTLSVREMGRRSFEIDAYSIQYQSYPGRRRVQDLESGERAALPPMKTTTRGLEGDLKNSPPEWRSVIQYAQQHYQWFVIRVQAAGGAVLMRQVAGWPWARWLAAWRGIVVIDGGDAQPRTRLELPLRIASPRGHDFVQERIDPFVHSFRDAGWRHVTSRPHVIHARAGDRFQHLATPETRLVVLEYPDGASPAPMAPSRYSVLRVTAEESLCIELSRLFYRNILHDYPLDAAALKAIQQTGPHFNRLTFNLLRNDEHALRLRQAIYDAADAVEAAAKSPKKARKNGGGPGWAMARPPEHLGLELAGGGASPLDLVNEIRGSAAAIDFEHEERGVSAATQVFASATAATNSEKKVRYANMWLTDTSNTLVPLTQSLPVDHDYWLRFVIDVVERPHAAHVRLDEASLRFYFEDRDTLDLDIVLYCDADKLQLETRQFSLPLKRWGRTSELATRCRTLAPGSHGVRACIYYKGNLIQTLVMRVGVGTSGEETRTDYHGLTSFAKLDKLAPRAMSLFINDDEDRHWIGVYVPGAAGATTTLQSASLALPDIKTFEDHARVLRELLGELEGVKEPIKNAAYRFANPLDALGQERADKAFLELARAGRSMFADVFENANEASPNGVITLQELLANEDQILSITRLDDRPSMPWALTYDLPFDPEAPDRSLCTRFREIDPATQRPFGESPSACSSRADCPHKAEKALTTACPFGFWGFRHQIELRMRLPEADGAAPLDRERVESADRPKAFTATYAAFPEAAPHINSLGAVVDAAAAVSDRDAVLSGLRKGEQSLYYFFCHGETTDKGGVVLKLADAPIKHLIAPTSIQVGPHAKLDNWSVDKWARIAPLVFLNACESVVLDARAASPFLQRFVRLGASAVIGTEVMVFTSLAAQFGKDLLELLTSNLALGDAFLRLRRRMLGAGNPMGLAYSAFGSAALHFHTATCSRCKA